MKSLLITLLILYSSTSFGQVNLAFGLNSMAEFAYSPEHNLQNRYVGYGFETILMFNRKQNKISNYFSIECNRTIEKTAPYFYKNISNEVLMVAHGQQISVGTGLSYEIYNSKKITCGVSLGYSFMFVDTDKGMMYRISDDSRVIISYYTGTSPYGYTVYPELDQWKDYVPESSLHSFRRSRHSIQLTLYGNLLTKENRNIGLTTSIDKFLIQNYGGFSITAGLSYSLTKATKND